MLNRFIYKPHVLVPFNLETFWESLFQIQQLLVYYHLILVEVHEEIK